VDTFYIVAFERALYHERLQHTERLKVDKQQWRNDGVAAASRDGGRATGKVAPDSSKFSMINI